MTTCCICGQPVHTANCKVILSSSVGDFHADCWTPEIQHEWQARQDALAAEFRTWLVALRPEVPVNRYERWWRLDTKRSAGTLTDAEQAERTRLAAIIDPETRWNPVRRMRPRKTKRR